MSTEILVKARDLQPNDKIKVRGGWETVSHVVNIDERRGIAARGHGRLVGSLGSDHSVADGYCCHRRSGAPLAGPTLMVNKLSAKINASRPLQPLRSPRAASAYLRE
jgi:hypothetical protein